MRVAALYDIHGNLPALEAVLGQVLEAGVNLIVVGGDVVPGPMPRETIQRLLGLERHTSYDLGAAAERIRATTFPWPDDFAARYVLQPPSESEMLEVFARASI